MASNENKAAFVYNSALTALNEEDGTFNEEEFGKRILPIQGKLMQLDGVFGCTIARYGVRVSYMSNVTTLDKVTKHVEAVFAWAADNGFFPLRDEGKSIEITFDPDNSH